jgi:putative ABC transport system permease protein
VKYLDVKRKRDFRRQRWQFIAVLVTITLGVMLFAASYDAYRNLFASYNGTYDRLGFADVTITGADDGFEAALAATNGVATTQVRQQADVPFRVDGDVFVGRVVTMPPDHQPEINKIDVVAGDYLSASQPDGVVVETHMAEEFGLSVGDSIEILAGNDWIEVQAVGVAVSAEYLWPAPSTQNFFPLPGTFGVVFASDAAVQALSGTTTANQVLALYKDGADRATTDATVTSAAYDQGAADVTIQADHASNKGLSLDLQGFEQMAVAFPVLFLLAAGMAAFILLTRVVYSQRSQIGTLLASGVSRRALTGHYLSYGLILGGVGAIIGTLLGMAAGWAITGSYTDSLGIPDTVREFHLITPIVGLLFGLVTGVLAAIVPARSVLRLNPADSMRGEVPKGTGHRSIIERVIPPLQGLPVRWLMVFRGVGRNKLRSFSTVIGVVLALTLILASWGMIDTVQIKMDRQFNEVDTSDATALFAVPVENAQVDAVATTAGVDSAEPVITLDASARSGSGSYGTVLQAYEADTQVHGFLTDSGTLPDTGILAGASVADEIGVDVGDTVTISLTTLESSFETVIAGFVDEPMGTRLYMERDALIQALGSADPPVTAETLADPRITTVASVFTTDADHDQVIAGIASREEVATVINDRALYDLIQQFMAFFYAFVGMMLLFGGAMAFALIFNTISVNIAERSSEYATMRANGLSQRRIAMLITGENLLLTLMGIVPGLVIGYLAAAALMASYTSDMLQFGLELRPSTFVFAALAMIAVTLLSMIPGIRSVGRLDIAEVVRERSN